MSTSRAAHAARRRTTHPIRAAFGYLVRANLGRTGIGSSSGNTTGHSGKVVVPQRYDEQKFSTVTVPRHEPPKDTIAEAATASAPVVDLRSDTMTKPCQRLRAAMSGAHVGDDMFGEDPTVSRLEEYVAYVLGKEKGLLVPRCVPRGCRV